MANALFVIHPYREDGIWMFDDERVGLAGEPFVAGIPEIIERVVSEQGIRGAESGFTLICSATPFPGATLELERQREEGGGTWYRWTATEMEGWLCPALFRYFDTAPERLYVQAKPKG
jgi:uncharacterized protein DUF6717